jgi:hypothetical protein
MARTRIYLVQDYAGGMLIRYAGKYRHVAQQRIQDSKLGGWSSRDFVIVTARSNDEAFTKAEPLLLAKKEPRMHTSR